MKKEVKKRPRIKYTQEEVDNFVLQEEYPKSKRFKDISGEVFGKWEVLQYAGKEGGTQPKYFCKCIGCDEGNIQKVYGTHLRNGVTTSCGCEHNKKVTDSKVNLKPDTHHETILKTFKETWKLLEVTNRRPLIYQAYCDTCKTSFSISQAAVILKSGGCKCTMLPQKGFDYNTPAWFYIFKVYGDDKTYWKYGVTQKQNVTDRLFNMVDGFKRDLIFYTAIRDRWETIPLEQQFKKYFQDNGLTSTKKGEVIRSGWTECFPSTPYTTEDTLLGLFWSLNPRVVPFHGDNLYDITVDVEDSLQSGVIKYFKLIKKEKKKYYDFCRSQNICAYEVDLTNPLHFDKISKFISKLRGD